MKIKRLQPLPRNMLQVRFAREVIDEMLQGLECESGCQYSTRPEMVQNAQIGKAIRQLIVFPCCRNDEIQPGAVSKRW